MSIRLRSGLGWWLCGGAWAAMAATAQPLCLKGDRLEPRGEDQQQAFQLLRSMPVAPVVQRPTRRGTAPLREEWSAALEAEGTRIRGYVPENVLLVEAAPAAVPKIAALDGVAWMGEYLPTYKKSPALDGKGAKDLDCVVTLFDPVDKRRIAIEFGEMNVFVPRSQFDADGAELRVRLTAAQIDKVATWAEVEWIEAVPPFRTWGSSGSIDKEESESLQATYGQG